MYSVSALACLRSLWLCLIFQCAALVQHGVTFRVLSFRIQFRLANCLSYFTRVMGPEH